MKEDTQTSGEDIRESADENGKYQEQEFIRLEELVYAPLHALVASNQQLRMEVLDAVRSMSEVRQQGKEEIFQLENMKIGYDRISGEEDDNCHIDNLQMQIPLLSVIPLTGLSIEKAEISFSAEVCVTAEQEGDYAVRARICSPEQRDSDFLPKVSYNLQVGSVPASEGILRLTDILSANQVVRQTDTTPVNMKGKQGTDEQKNIWKEIDRLRGKVKRLKSLFQKVQKMLQEQEKLYQISKEGFSENAYDYDRDKYLMVQTNIMNRIMKYQTQIMDFEIAYGLDKD